jgi:uncharacterized protein (AIM24 family)
MSIDYEVTDLISANIKNVSGFDHLEIEIKDGAAIYTRAECQLIIDNSLEMKASVGGKGIFSGFVRSLSTGTFFMNKISVANANTSKPLTFFGGRRTLNEANEVTANRVAPLPNEVAPLPNEVAPNEVAPKEVTPNEVTPNEVTTNEVTPPNSGIVSIYSIIPGNIQQLDLKPGDEWCVHNSCFICSTENITVTSGISFSTFFTGNGLLFTTIRNDSNKNGMVWLSAYGGIIEKKLTEKKEFKVHSGLFLAMPKTIYNNVKTTLASSIISTIANGQGIFMDFSQTVPTDNDILYLQSGNLDDFLNMVSPPSYSFSYNSDSGAAPDMGDTGGDTSGGYKRRITKKSKKRTNKHLSRRKY